MAFTIPNICSEGSSHHGHPFEILWAGIHWKWHDSPGSNQACSFQYPTAQMNATRPGRNHAPPSSTFYIFCPPLAVSRCFQYPTAQMPQCQGSNGSPTCKLLRHRPGIPKDLSSVPHPLSSLYAAYLEGFHRMDRDNPQKYWIV